LQDAQQLPGARDLAAADAQRIHEIRAAEGDGALERAGVDEDRFAVVRDV